jgi:hypothetical protein
VNRPDNDTAGTSRDWLGRGRWFAAEFLVVVTGVLVALAVQAWYQRISDRRNEQDYLRQLASDLSETKKLMAAADSTSRRGEHAGTMLVRAFNDPAPPGDSVLHWLAGLGGVIYRLPVMGTVEALIASGDLRLIRNDSLRAAIAAYLDETRSLADLYGKAMDRWYQGRGHLRQFAEPFDAAVMAGNLRRPGDVRGNPLCDPHPDGSTRVAFALDPQAFLRSRGAYAVLAEMKTTKSLLWIIRSQFAENANELRALVDRQLRKQQRAYSPVARGNDDALS